jgi:hypothetical protein
MEADTVNDVSETEESELVLNILEQTFFDIVDEFSLPSKKINDQLTASGTSNKPTHMTIPNDITRVEFVLYDKKNEVSDPINYEDVWYADPKRFMQLINSRDEDDSTVDKVTDDSGVKFLILNDRNPTWWTSFDDEVMIFDAYDSNLESWLQNSKSWITAWQRPSWSGSNNDKPDIPEHLEQYLFNEAASLAYVNLKQTANQKIEQRAQRARRSAMNTWKRAGNKIRTPNYGRK